MARSISFKIRGMTTVFTVIPEILASTRGQGRKHKRERIFWGPSKHWLCVEVDDGQGKHLKIPSACYVNSSPANYKTFAHSVVFVEGQKEAHMACQCYRKTKKWYQGKQKSIRNDTLSSLSESQHTVGPSQLCKCGDHLTLTHQCPPGSHSLPSVQVRDQKRPAGPTCRGGRLLPSHVHPLPLQLVSANSC